MSLITRQAKGSKLTIEEMDGNLTYLEQIAQEGGGGLEGSQYLFVAANGTDTENAAQLQDAYDEAKTMTPSATNRITIIAAPGNYNFSSNFEMDTEFIDLVSLDGNRSIIFNGSGTISITENDVFVKGVDVQDKNFTIGDNLNLLKVENCKGGNFSFGGDTTFGGNPITVSGTFINCEGGFRSFGYFGTASGIFTDCVGGDFLFGSGFGTASGIFINCKGGNGSFGGDGDGGFALGTFTNCEGGDFSFGTSGIASGTFTNCVGGRESFGAYGTASGTFTDCVGGNGSFGGGFGTVSGIFTNCVGGDQSFRGVVSGKLYYCRLTDGTFETVSSGGVTVLCIDGNNQINTQN